MARVELPFVVRDNLGNAVSNCNVEVFLRNSASHADVYDAETAGNIKVQPFNPSSDGSIVGWIEENTSYDVKVSGGAIQTAIVQPFEAVRADSQIQSAKLADASVITTKLADQNVTRAKLALAVIQTVRVTTGSINATTASAITVTWANAFADANYTVSATVEEATVVGTDTLRVRRIRNKLAGSVDVIVYNQDSSSRTGTLHVVGWHD